MATLEGSPRALRDLALSAAGGLVLESMRPALGIGDTFGLHADAPERAAAEEVAYLLGVGAVSASRVDGVPSVFLPLFFNVRIQTLVAVRHVCEAFEADRTTAFKLCVVASTLLVIPVATTHT